MRPPYDAVIFGLDGVVTDTRPLHVQAWQRLLDEVLGDPRAAVAADVALFDPDVDYRRYLDGRAREDGLKAFLRSRGVELPAGSVSDTVGSWTAHGLAARSDQFFLTLLSKDGVRAFPGTVALLQRLRQGGTPLGLVTASGDAPALLSAVGLAGAFDVVVGGELRDALHASSEPDPNPFLEAARLLGVRPERAAVVEDTVVGVRAARAAGFAAVVGINRDSERRDLEVAGADYVLDDVGQLDLGASRRDPWLLVYEGFDPSQELHREALTTLGNGHFATRGAAPEHRDDGVHYPGTYLAGVYNRLSSTVEGQVRVDEELVNGPNWLPFDLRRGDGGWWSEGAFQEEGETRELDLRVGTLTRTLRLSDGKGCRLRVVQRRVVSMDRPHLAALETTIVSEGWSGPLTLYAGVDTCLVNRNGTESRLLANRHLSAGVVVEAAADTLLVEVETTQSRIRIATALRSVVSGAPVNARRAVPGGRAGGSHGCCYDVQVAENQPVTLTKFVAIVTSRDPAIASPADGALAELRRVDADFDELLRRHKSAWRRLWDRFAIDVSTDDPLQLTVNLHLFHLLQSISPHTAALDAGTPARGLHGEGYRGHVFWDELFVLPLYLLRAAPVARALLDYRWRRLDEARYAARQEGQRGAMFPWQSGSDGRDETPRSFYNPRSQRWMPDHSWRQRHVGLAVAFNAWQYYQVSGDTVWFAAAGAELVIEVARFFTSLATFEESDRRFHIAGVMGPDEFHDGYPDRSGEGLRDNAYTNIMTAWVCRRAVESLALLPIHERHDLTSRIGLGAEEERQWAALSRALAVPFHDGMISQFAGYGDLVEFDWAGYRRRYGDIQRLDLILEAEGRSPNDYRLSKQADVLMLVYLLGPAELISVLAELGYAVSDDELLRTVDYYRARTAHGSTLSRVVHTSVLAMLNQSIAWTEFREALDADLDDTQGGTTGHGIHLGAMAGTVDVLLRTFTGIKVRADALIFQPRAPGALRGLAFEVVYRGRRIAVTMSQRSLSLRSYAAAGDGVEVVVNGTAAQLKGGNALEFPLG
jgi:HAD superfamily hydrolase (TIGR01509 family)